MKRPILASLVLLGGAALSATPTLSAHHSFAATYLGDKEVKIEGEIIAFMFRNPHSFVQVMAPDDKGKLQRWNIEWSAAGSLRDIKRDTLKPGDHVIVTANPGRVEADHILKMISISRPSDGFKWSGGFE